MTLIELPSSAALQDFIQSTKTGGGGSNSITTPIVVVTFSAHWCGPCRMMKPSLMSLATTTTALLQNINKIKMGIVYEDVLGNDIHSVYHVRAFPTHVLFMNGIEKQRVEGANLSAIEAMIKTHLESVSTIPSSGGETLGGSNTVVLSPDEARMARLAKLGNSSTGGNTTASTTATTDTTAEGVVNVAASSLTTTPEGTTSLTTTDTSMTMNENDDDNKNDDTKPSPIPIEKEDVEMMDASETKEKTSETATTTMIDPTSNLNSDYLQTLTETMGFTLLRAQKGLLHGNNTVEGAIEWLMVHQDDVDIDEPIPLQESGAAVAQSYKCNECNKLFSNMANLELHANKTGHSDFEESTQAIKPLTAEEKVAKIAEIKQLLKLKRTEREEAEKVDDLEREIQRRQMGKEMAKTKEQLEIEQRKREAMLRKKEKADFARERERLRQELARDKAERASGKGKLSSRLGVDGYKPDGIQYDINPDAAKSPNGDAAAAVSTDDNHVETNVSKPAKKKADPTKMDDYIKKVSSYRAGGDGGKCLQILMIYIGNIIDHPTEEKYKTIKMDNKAYRAKVKPFIGAKDILLACGFVVPENNSEVLVLQDDQIDMNLLTSTKEKLQAALDAFNK